MRRACVVAALVGCSVVAGFAGGALAQDREHPVPLGKFVALFTDTGVTSAQKEFGLPEGTWYEGTVTVSDVELYRKQGSGEDFAEIKDVSNQGGCYMLLFRVQDTAKALALKVGDKVVVRRRLANMGMSTTKYVLVCETRFALFKDCEILEVLKPAK